MISMRQIVFGLNPYISIFKHFWFWTPSFVGFIAAIIIGYTSNQVVSIDSVSILQTVSALKIPLIVIISSISLSMIFVKLHANVRSHVDAVEAKLLAFKDKKYKQFVEIIENSSIFDKWNPVEFSRPRVLFDLLFDFSTIGGEPKCVLHNDALYRLSALAKYCYRRLREASGHPDFKLGIELYAAAFQITKAFGLDFYTYEETLEARREGLVWDGSFTHIATTTVEKYIRESIHICDDKNAHELINSKLNFYKKVFMNSKIFEYLFRREIMSPLFQVEPEYEKEKQNPHVATMTLD